jgi:hypothetical protein
MFHRRNWIAVTVVILGLFMFVAFAQAERQEFEYISCTANTYNMVHSSPEIAIFSYDGKSILRSTHESKLFDNWTANTVGIVKAEGSKFSWHALGKTMGPDGEFILWEGVGDSESGATWKCLYGTGKWMGIKGERKAKRITRGKPIVQATEQFCEQHVGWIELPK